MVDEYVTIQEKEDWEKTFGRNNQLCFIVKTLNQSFQNVLECY